MWSRFGWAGGCALCFAVACGGVTDQRQAPPVATAGAPNETDAGPDADSGPDADAEFDAGAVPDAAVEADAGAPDSCSLETMYCCDRWTGASSRPQCEDGFSWCKAHGDLQALDTECIRTPDVCHTDSVIELDGKACFADTPSCRIGAGCSSCQCTCLETAVWQCACNAC